MALSGCLFFRLSRVLVQMKEPYRYIEVDLDAEVFRGKLKEPVVYLSDVETIVGIDALASGNHWVFEFEKLGPSDREPWSVFFWTTERGKVDEFALPPRVTSILGNTWVMSGIKAVGKAEVSIRKRRVFLNIQEKLLKSQVLELLGEPSKREGENWIYQFGSMDQPMMLSLVMSEEGAKSLLMSSGKLSAMFKFLVDSDHQP